MIRVKCSRRTNKREIMLGKMLTSGRNLNKNQHFPSNVAKVELSLHAKVICKLLQLAQVRIVNCRTCVT